MRIGELARSAGVNIQTIRFYEREALLPKPMRDASGYRSYDRGDLERVTFIKRNQEIGFTLAEIKQLIQLHGSMAARPKDLRRKPDEVRAIISLGRERLQAIDEKVRSLRDTRRQLVSVVQQLESMSAVICPMANSVPSQPKKLRPKSSGKCPLAQESKPVAMCPVANLPKQGPGTGLPRSPKKSS